MCAQSFAAFYRITQRRSFVICSQAAETETKTEITSVENILVVVMINNDIHYLFTYVVMSLEVGMRYINSRLLLTTNYFKSSFEVVTP